MRFRYAYLGITVGATEFVRCAKILHVSWMERGLDTHRDIRVR